MKKIVSVVVVIILVLVAVELGGSYYVGNFAEQRYRQVVALINETPGVSAEILSYQKGWFRSQIETQIKTVQNTFNLKSTILHGPFIIDRSMRPFFQVGLAVQRGEFDNTDSILGVPGKVQWAMRFPFTGGINFGVNGEQGDYQHKSVYISSKAWKGDGSASRDLKSYQYDALYPEIILREKKEVTNAPQIRLSGIKTDVEYKHDENERQLEGSYSIDSIAGEGGIPGSLNGLTVSHVVKMLPDTVQLDLDAKIQQIGLFNQQYGPGALKFDLVNLDKAAVQSLWEMYVTHQNASDPAVNQAKLMAAAKAILVRKPKLVVDDLSFTLLEGTVSGKGSLTLGGPEITDPSDSKKLIQTMEGDIYAVVPKAVFRTLAKQQARQNLAQSIAQNPQVKTMDPQQIQASIDQGADQFIADLMKNEILTEKDANNYEIKVAFSHGRWMAGGHEVTIPEAVAPTPVPPVPGQTPSSGSPQDQALAAPMIAPSPMPMAPGGSTVPAPAPTPSQLNQGRSGPPQTTPQPTPGATPYQSTTPTPSPQSTPATPQPTLSTPTPAPSSPPIDSKPPA